MLNISYEDSFGLSSVISSQLTLEISVTAGNLKQIHQTFLFGNSRSFKVIHVGTTEKLIPGCDRQTK